MNELNLSGIHRDNSGIEPVELTLNSKFGDNYKLALNEDELIASNKAEEVVRRVPRIEAGSILEFKPSVGNRSELKLKKLGDERDLVLRTHEVNLRMIKEWMGPLTPGMLKLALRQVVGQNVFFGGLCLLLLIMSSSNILLVGWGILAFALAGGAYFLPRPEWFLADILIDLFVLLSLLAVSLITSGSWLLLGFFLVMILLNLPAKIARFRFWNN
jgi:hypothetical protein